MWLECGGLYFSPYTRQMFTASVLVYGLLELGEFPTEPVTSEAHPYSLQGHPRAGSPPGSLSPLPQLHAPVSLKLPTGIEVWLEDRGTCGVAELCEETPWRGAIPVEARGGFGVNQEIAGGEFLCVYTDCGLVSLARLRPVRGRQTRIKYVIGLTGLAEAFCHSWYQSKKISGMADRRDWGGGGDDLEESTQRMIERIWESLTDIWARMDQQAPVPPVAVPPGDGEAVPVAPVPPRVGVPFAAPVPPPPVLIAEEPVMQVEKFLRLQPPTYSGGPNPDTTEHWVHEIERVFATMRCLAADKVVLAAYQLRGFALEWWRLKMQTTFSGRTEEAITWSEFLDLEELFSPISSMVSGSGMHVGSVRVSAGKELKNMASTSLVAKLISQDIDGQIPCRLLPVSGSRCGRLLVYKQKRLFK
ncbi:hypothetical protein Taro_027179, partial [Colocasia esculenta]|nr:hypothetical protein [Colocasia esculenta]